MDDTPNPARAAERWRGAVALAYGVAAYLAFLATFAYFLGFLTDLAVPRSVDAPVRGGPRALAVAVDLGLVALFGLQHSIMARPAFKRLWTRLVPPAVERSTYVLTASLALALLMALWHPLPAVVWRVSSPLGQAALWGLFGAALLVMVSATFEIDHFDLFGLRQVTLRLRNRPYTPVPFRARRLYRVVRHPMQTGMLVLLCSTPRMTVGHLLLAAGLSGYNLIGLYYEERDLVAHLGAVYRDYRERVPRLLPGTGRRSPGAAESDGGSPAERNSRRMAPDPPRAEDSDGSSTWQAS